MSGDHSGGFGSDDVQMKILLWTVQKSLDFKGMVLDCDSARRSQVGGEAPRGAPPPPPPPPPLRALRQTLANRGNITKPRRVALRCQALTPPITLATLWPAAAPPGGLTSAALARDCYRRFKVCLLHFTCVIASYDG